MKLARGLKIAERVAEEVAPFCDQVEIAGSIRRRRDWVNDIDLVMQVKAGREADFRSRCQRCAAVIKDGPQEMVLRLATGEQLDLWIARRPSMDLLEFKPGNFGSLLLCRTGSKEHNIYLVERAKELGLVWSPHEGVFDRQGLATAKLIAWESEEAIFAALELGFVPPERREA